MPWLLRAVPYDPALPGLRTLYFSDIGFNTKPSESPANTHWVGKILVPPTLEQSLFEGEGLGGQGSYATGALTLLNEDGELDYLGDLVWAGHDVEILYTDNPEPVLADFATQVFGVAKQPVLGDSVTIQIVDRRDLTEKAWQTARFAGTGGVEGEEDWAEVLKPRVLGYCRQIPLAMIDEALHIASYGDASSGGLVIVRDRGIPLRRGGNFPDYASLIAANFGPDATGPDYFTCDALSLIRFRGPPAQPVTADPVGRIVSGNLITNGGFDSGLTGWSTTGSGWSASAGTALHTPGGASALFQNVTTQAGAWYRLSFSCGTTAGNLTVTAAGVNFGVFGLDSRRTFVWQAVGATTEIRVAADAVFSGSVDGFNVNQIYARAGEMLEFILLNYAGLTAGDIESSDIAALNLAQPGLLQFFTEAGAELFIPQALNEICATVGASWGFNPTNGKFNVKRFEEPGPSADTEILEESIFKITPRASAVRLREQTVTWGRRWRVLGEQDLSGGITDQRKETLLKESRDAVAVHAPTSVQARKWKDEKLDSLFVRENSAQAEADRRAALHGPARQSFEMELIEDVPAIVPGITVRVVHKRYGLATGKNFRVLRVARDGETRTMSLTIWG